MVCFGALFVYVLCFLSLFSLPCFFSLVIVSFVTTLKLLKLPSLYSFQINIIPSLSSQGEALFGEGG